MKLHNVNNNNQAALFRYMKAHRYRRLKFGYDTLLSLDWVRLTGFAILLSVVVCVCSIFYHAHHIKKTTYLNNRGVFYLVVKGEPPKVKHINTHWKPMD